MQGDEQKYNVMKPICPVGDLRPLGDKYAPMNGQDVAGAGGVQLDATSFTCLVFSFALLLSPLFFPILFRRWSSSLLHLPPGSS